MPLLTDPTYISAPKRPYTPVNYGDGLGGVGLMPPKGFGEGPSTKRSLGGGIPPTEPVLDPNDPRNDPRNIRARRQRELMQAPPEVPQMRYGPMGGTPTASFPSFGGQAPMGGMPGKGPVIPGSGTFGGYGGRGFGDYFGGRMNPSGGGISGALRPPSPSVGFRPQGGLSMDRPRPVMGARRGF